ncbi:MAG TPA: hypothetical protein DCF61_10285 [Alphaproteobacteria bacterium]|nr:hypothetical protein [Alphaproteobacteria bacterium]
MCGLAGRCVTAVAEPFCVISACSISARVCFHPIAATGNLPAGGSLFVGQSVEPPKLKGMYAGALKWVRAHAK